MSLALVALVSSAWPCAGLVHEEGTLAESDGAEILFEPGAGSVTVTYEVAYTGDAADFGWIIPIPGAFTSLVDGDPELFADLRELSAPLVEAPDESGDSGGCMGASKSSDALGGSAPGDALDVVAEGFTGSYAYTVLEATSVDALQTWMAENGWSSGLDPDAAASYVAEGHAFVLISVLPDTAADRLPPVRITYAGDTLSFPAKMARTAAAPDQRTTLYVIADQGAAVADGWTEQVETRLFGELGEDPQVPFEAWLADLGAARAYGRVYTGPWGDATLTRFDTLAPASVHDRDVVLSVSGAPDTRLTVVLGPEGGGQAALWLLPLTGLLLARRKRQRSA